MRVCPRRSPASSGNKFLSTRESFSNVDWSHLGGLIHLVYQYTLIYSGPTGFWTRFLAIHGGKLRSQTELSLAYDFRFSVILLLLSAPVLIYRLSKRCLKNDTLNNFTVDLTPVWWATQYFFRWLNTQNILWVCWTSWGWKLDRLTDINYLHKSVWILKYL